MSFFSLNKLNILATIAANGYVLKHKWCQQHWISILKKSKNSIEQHGDKVSLRPLNQSTGVNYFHNSKEYSNDLLDR